MSFDECFREIGKRRKHNLGDLEGIRMIRTIPTVLLLSFVGQAQKKLSYVGSDQVALSRLQTAD
jgi:hypothetical protein